MFSAIRFASAARVSTRAFSSSAARSGDLAKLILIGNVGRAPESRQTKNDKEYMTYSVATNSYPPPSEGGERPPPITTWHRIMCFSPSQFDYLRNVPKGTKVYVEADYEMKEPDPEADPESPQAQRHVFLRQQNFTVLSRPPNAADIIEQQEQAEDAAERF